ncbi:LPS export ABC transporter periplasmic protein LptC [Maribellus sediminis]|uniref:LPS export ABC transporter periplasmic protein LptC n=1 Tax=Maribellus sediminis TaxID=2696285 RepID=UPI0023F84AC1|nr:LPS export ABC transporter periplasmic protein LptC [Maribellus sediminis]
MKIQKLDSKILHRIKQISIAVLFMGAAILFYACESNNLAEIKAFSAPENLPIQEATNFQTTYTDSGKIRYTLKTPKLLRFETDGVSYTEFPQGVEIVKYDAQQKIVSSIRADYAKEFVKEAKWEAKNNVVVTNLDGDSLLTEHLIWEEKNEKIYTEEFVKIIREDQIITGVGLTSDQNMENWKIKNVKGILYVTVNKEPKTTQENQPLQIAQPERPDIPKPQDTDKAIQFK